MRTLPSRRLVALAVGLTATLALAAAAQASLSSHARARATVELRKTALGSILVDARGRTLYLFEKDRNGVSRCNAACTTYWPALTSQGAPRAGKGIHQSLLSRTRSADGVQRQVTYAGHPLYTFVGDKRAGSTSGEGLDNFGGEWYAVAANGTKVERDQSSGSAGNATGGYGGYGG